MVNIHRMRLLNYGTEITKCTKKVIQQGHRTSCDDKIKERCLKTEDGSIFRLGRRALIENQCTTYSKSNIVQYSGFLGC